MAQDLSLSARKDLITTLCDVQIPSTIRFSPNGQQVLYSTNLTWNHFLQKGKHAVSTIWLADTGKPDSARQITSGLYNDHNPRWSPDGKSIAFVSDRAKAGEKWAIYSLGIRQSATEGEACPLTNVEHERPIPQFEFSPDGTTIAFVSADEKTKEQKAQEEDGDDVQIWGENLPFARLHMIDVKTKQVQCLTETSRHVSGFSWSPDGKKIAVASNRSPDIEDEFINGTDLAVMTLSDQQTKQICSFPNYLKELTWASDGKLYFISGTPVGSTCTSSTVYGVPSDGSSSNENGAEEAWTRVAFGFTDEAVHLRNVGGEVVVKVENGFADELHLLSSQRTLFTRPEELEAFDAIFSSDSDEILLATATSNLNQPLEVYTSTASGGSLVALSNHGAAFKGQTFGSCKFISCRSDDDEVDLDAVLLTPSESSEVPEAPSPTIVLPHGGPTARSTNAFNAYYYFWTPYLLRLGYTVLLPNYRGGTGKGEHFAAYSLKGVGKGDYDDVITLTDHAVKLGYSDPSRLVIGGLSQGGFLTYLCSTRNGSRRDWKFKASIPLAGICESEALALTSDLGGCLEAELNGGMIPWTLHKEDTRIRQSSALWEVQAAVDRSKETGEMVIPPMLILHGEKDERCPLTQAWGMRRALEAHGLEFQFVTYPRQAHLFTERKFWVDLAIRVGDWSEKYIGPGAPAKRTE